MRGVFDDDEPELREPRQDTELTLGSGTLLLIFFGLVLLCGLCFGLGYTMGHHAAPAQAAPQNADGSHEPLQAAGLPKPTATMQAAVATTQTSTPNSANAASTATAPTVTEAVAPPSSAPAAQAGQPMVHPALATGPTNLHTAQSAIPTVQPALPSQSRLMVQIAAVQNPEDADVLLNALRKRGYAVTAVRNPTDNLIHVRIGPFNNRQEAGRWQQRLLNDGYNAVLLP